MLDGVVLPTGLTLFSPGANCERNGNARLAANHRQVVADLSRVIDALELIEPAGGVGELR